MWSLTASFLLLAFCVWILWRKKRFSLFKELGIPGPEPSLLFGNLLQLLRKSPMECHKEWIRKYGKVCGYYFGTIPFVIVSDDELIKKIEVSDFQKFINRPKPPLSTKPEPGDGFSRQLTVLRDKRWKEIRSIMTPSFTTRKLRAMVPNINKAIDSMMAKIDGNSKAGESFDIYQMYKGLSMDIIGRTSFGIQTNCQNDPEDPFMKTIQLLTSGSFMEAAVAVAAVFPELELLWQKLIFVLIILTNRLKNPVKKLVDSVQEIIRQRRTSGKEHRQDLLQLMIDARMDVSDLSKFTASDLTAGEDANDHKEDQGKSKSPKDTSPTGTKLLHYMNDDEILSNSVLFFLAGFETTSTALAFTTYFLLHHPEIQERLRDEINDVRKEGELDYDVVTQLQYMDQVLNESLRMYPPIYAFVSREVGENVIYGNYLFKKGLTVLIPAHSLQHDPEYWPEPEKFDPDRFSPENKSKINPITFQAFGGGPRNCIGMRFAQMGAKLILSRILHKYKLVLCEETAKLPETLHTTMFILKPGNGVHLRAIAL